MTQIGISAQIDAYLHSFLHFGSYLSQTLMDFASIWVILKPIIRFWTWPHDRLTTVKDRSLTGHTNMTGQADRANPDFYQPYKVKFPTAIPVGWSLPCREAQATASRSQRRPPAPPPTPASPPTSCCSWSSTPPLPPPRSRFSLLPPFRLHLGEWAHSPQTLKGDDII